MDLGADDYLTKPFQLLELRARVQAVIRRFYGRTNPIIEVGALTIHPASRKVMWNNKEILLACIRYSKQWQRRFLRNWAANTSGIWTI